MQARPQRPRLVPCPKCGGTLILEQDQHGPYLRCLNCGKLVDLRRFPQDQPPAAAGPPQQADTGSAPPPAGDTPNPGPDSFLPPAGDGRRRTLPAPDRQERDLEIVRLVTQEDLSPGEVAPWYELSTRTIYRILEQGRTGAGEPRQPEAASFKTTIRRRLYRPGEFVRLSDPGGPHGDLSPMAPGYPLTVNGITFPFAEALYQALKFPDHPQVQQQLARLPSGMETVGAAYRRQGFRAKWWRRRRVAAMAYTQAVRLSQHPDRFSQALTATGDLTIVAEFPGDPYWGAEPEGDAVRGCNVLGRVLTELRDLLVRHDGEMDLTLAAFLEQVSTEGLAINGKPVPPLA